MSLVALATVSLHSHEIELAPTHNFPLCVFLFILPLIAGSILTSALIWEISVCNYHQAWMSHYVKSLTRQPLFKQKPVLTKEQQNL